jgi:hypothetical protein
LPKGRLLALQESAACVTEQKLELNSGNVAGAAGKGRYVGFPTTQNIQNETLSFFKTSLGKKIYSVT